MDEMYGFYSSFGSEYYTDKALMSPENLILPCDYQTLFFSPSSSSSFRDHRTTLHHPVFGSDELISAASAISEAASITPEFHPDDDVETLIKAKIKSHPSYPRLLQAYIDCQKVVYVVVSLSPSFSLLLSILSVQVATITDRVLNLNLL